MWSGQPKLILIAHLIRNSDSQMARAVCALNSVSRWAVTGTPIQNHINDLAALLRFLGIYPYSEKRVFDADISHLWKTGKADEAVKRLKRLAGCLLLRRPKGIVQLPPRQDQALYVEFDHRERELYDQARTRVIARIDESLRIGTQVTSSFVSILQQIEAMRMICNLGLLYPSRHDTPHEPSRAVESDDWQDLAQSAFNYHFDMVPVQCHSCSFALDQRCNPFADVETVKPLFSRCWRFICSSCAQQATRRIAASNCGHVPPCSIAPVSASPLRLEESPLSLSLDKLREISYYPTKVKALIEDLEGQSSDVKS